MSTKNDVSVYDGVSQKDPLDLMSYVNKVVEITIPNNEIKKGTVVTVDPITETYVLAVPGCSGVSIQVIMGGFVKNVKVLDETPVSFEFKCATMCDPASRENQIQKMNRLKAWLEKNMIPVEVNNDSLKISDSVIIDPPYRTEDVISSNEMVLHKILSIIEKMPET